MKILKLVFLFLLLTKILFSQSDRKQIISKTNKNNDFFLNIYSKGYIYDTSQTVYNGRIINTTNKVYRNVVDIYHIESKKWLQSIQIDTLSNLEIEQSDLNNSGKVVFVKIGKRYIIWDIMSGNVIRNINNAERLALSKDNTFFLVYKYGRLASYNISTGEQLLEYKTKNKKDIFEELYTTEDDKYIIAKTTNNQIYVWKVNDSKIQKKLNAIEIKFSKDFKYCYSLQVSNNEMFTNCYVLPDFKLKRSVSSNKIIEQAVSISTEEALKNVGKEFVKISEERTSLSPYGKYTTCFIIFKYRGKKHRNLVVFNNVKNNIEDIIFSRNNFKDKTFTPYCWIGEDSVVVNTYPLNAAMVDVHKKEKLRNISFMFNDEKGRDKHRFKSPDNEFVILQKKEKKNSVLTIKHSYTDKVEFSLEGFSFLHFSNNSKHIFVQDKQNNIGFIQISSIDTCSPKSQLKVHFFSQKLHSSQQEDLIAYKSKRPETDKYRRIKNMKNIGNITDSARLSLHLKTIKVDEKFTGLNVHLIDQNGNYYKGAASEKWKHIWCNIILRNSEGEYIPINNFEVQEYTEKDERPVAIVLLLDHSGSMGEERAKELQKTTIEFIKKKKKQDAIAIIKYDNNIKVEANLTKDVDKLIRKLDTNGITNFGNSTAILDAIDKGILLLKDIKNFKNKVIILLTDGNENSSFCKKNNVINNAIKHNIKIYTVGLGNDISEDYLKTIAHNTRGGYYKIYNSGEFSWIFNDIDKKLRNYYTIKFNTKTAGKYMLMAELCFHNYKDTFTVEFDNSKLNVNSQNNMNDEVFINMINEISTDTFKFKKYDKQLIDDYKKIKISNVRFKFARSVFVEGTQKELDEVFHFLIKYPNITVQIHGHTDNIGDEKSNLELSWRRAKTVKRYLVRKGINKKRMKTFGYGETKPISKEDTEKARALNRRVEFILE